VSLHVVLSTCPLCKDVLCVPGLLWVHFTLVSSLQLPSLLPSFGTQLEDPVLSALHVPPKLEKGTKQGAGVVVALREETSTVPLGRSVPGVSCP